MSTHDDYQELLTLACQFDLDVPVMQGQLTCAFVGEWSHGKSALLNSLIGLPLLPSGPTPTNKTIVRLSLGEAAEPVATVHADTDAVRQYTGQAAIEALQGAREHLLGIDYRAVNLDLPADTVFIDTPGLNDTDQMASSRAESVAADVVVFVINADVSAINQTQIEFIQQVLLAKADLSDLFFVFTHGDLVQDARDRDRLRERLGAEIGPDHIFFLSNKDQSGVQAFKRDFYAWLAERRATLLATRQERQLRRLRAELERAVKSERVALTHYRAQTKEERLRLLDEIQAARIKESTKKSDLRERGRQRRDEALRDLRRLLANGEERIDAVIDASRPEQLKQPGYLKDKIDAIMAQQIQPAVHDRLEAILRAVQGDVEEGQAYSTQLLAELDIQLPPHQSVLSRVTAEQVLPIAVLGSIAIFGWLTVPTLLLGFLTLKARQFGLVRYADQTGLLDLALDKVKDAAAGAYRQAVKVTVAQVFGDYLRQISAYFGEVLKTATEQALSQIELVAGLEARLRSLRDAGDQAIIERESRVDRAEALLAAYPLVSPLIPRHPNPETHPMNLFRLKPRMLGLYQNLIDDAELFSSQTEALQQARDHLDQERFSLVAAGRFSAGKSTLINRAFLGADILPVRNDPTTCHPVHIVYGPENCLTLRDVAGGVETIVGDEKIAQALNEFGAQNQGRQPDQYQHFELAWNDPEMLGQGVVLVDTIGTEDTEEHYIQKTYAEMEKASAVLFLFNMEQVGTDSELKFLDRYLADTGKKLFLVLNRADTRDEDEQREILDDFSKRIQPFFAARQIRVEDRVFVVSAKTKQGTDELRRRLVDFIANDRFRELLREHAGRLAITLRGVRDRQDREHRDLLARQAGDNQVLREQQQQIERLEEDLKHRRREIDALRDEVIECAIDEAKGELAKLLDDTLDKVRIAVDKEALKYALERLPNDLKRIFDRTGRQVQSRIREGLRERIKSWSGRPDFDAESLFDPVISWRAADIAAFAARLAEALGGAGSIWGIIAGASTFMGSVSKVAQTGKVALAWNWLWGGATAPAIVPALTAAGPLVLGGLVTVVLGHQLAKWMGKKSLQSCKDEVSKSLRNTIKQLQDNLQGAITDYAEQQTARFLDQLEQHIDREKARLEALLREKDPAALERAIAASQSRIERAKAYQDRLDALQKSIT